MKVVVDSSGWIEYFSGGRKADQFAKFITGSHELILPTIILFEVYRKIKKVMCEEDAIFAVTQMQKGVVVPLDADLAVYAADISIQHQLAMADAIVYATALYHNAQLVTGDRDFRGLEDVKLIN